MDWKKLSGILQTAIAVAVAVPQIVGLINGVVNEVHTLGVSVALLISGLHHIRQGKC